MDISVELVPLLEQINFANKYKKLCEDHLEIKKSMDTYRIDEIEKFYKDKGLNPIYIKKDNYFPRRGYLQFVFHLRSDTKKFRMGFGMWESITEELLNEEYARKPTFCTLEELIEVLSESYSVYSDFKAALSKSTI